MNRWEIYELLKGNKNYDINDLENSNGLELIEGIKEYVLSRRGE